MTVTISQFFAPTQLSGSAATIFTAPSGAVATVAVRVRFTNTDTAPHQVTAYAIQNGGSASAGNAFMNAEGVAPNTHLDIDVPVLTASGFVQAFADQANKVTMFQISGFISS